jgi:hypothetical protein
MSLGKMARGMIYTSKKPETSLCHHEIIKMLVRHELRKKNTSWKQFFTQIFSKEVAKKKKGKTLATTEPHKRNLGNTSNYEENDVGG